MLTDQDGSLRARMDMGPLIDVVLTLLVLFIALRPVFQHAVRLPSLQETSASPAALGGCPLLLRMDREGGLFMGAERLFRDDFAKRLRLLTEGNTGNAFLVWPAGIFLTAVCWTFWTCARATEPTTSCWS